MLGVISLEAKRLGREADHSPPSSGKAKNAGASPPLLHTHSWLGNYLIKSKDNKHCLPFYNFYTK
jgi:hypothetical protein